MVLFDGLKTGMVTVENGYFECPSYQDPPEDWSNQ